ncbi:CHAT domain-containing protein [Nonomuraea diastatica]|uniref:CHAT domain-containing protein n=1 Tax=Nonomuraea diastatica TaxID=1848329 RepID=A0A4R4WMC4_9ACTN|nr:CHAT domain-containing protein [Nonomuraea diastatica]TDD19711.1 CHAT domain-containing protein [Nonomuraea diastatica]
MNAAEYGRSAPAEVLAAMSMDRLDDFARTRNASRLEEAIRLARQALAATSPGNADDGHAMSCFALMAALSSRYARHGEPADLEEAIRHGRWAQEITPDGDEAKIGILSLLTESLLDLVERNGDRETLKEAIELQRNAVRLAVQTPLLGKALSMLGRALTTWTELTGELAALEEAMATDRHLLEREPDDPHILESAANRLHDWYRITGALSALEEAVLLHRRSLGHRPDGSEYRHVVLANLGVTLQDRYEHSQRQADIDEAISRLREALATMPAGYRAQGQRLAGLAQALQTRFEHEGDRADLEEAVRLSRQAVAVTPPGHPQRGDRLTDLAHTYVGLSQATGEPVDADELIRLRQEALDLLPAGHRDRAVARSNLGDAYRFRYERSGRFSDLGRARDLCEQAMDDLADDHPHRDQCLFNAASVWRHRFDHAGDLDALGQAIDAFREAARLFPHASLRQRALVQLASALRARYDRVGDLPDLRDAITFGRECVQLVPDDHIAHNNLGNTLQAWYETTGDADVLRQAVAAGRRAVDLLPSGHHYEVMYLMNLAHSLQIQAEGMDDMTALDEAVGIIRRAAAVAARRTPLVGPFRFNVAVIMRTRFERAGDAESRLEAVAAFRETARDEATPPQMRVKAGIEWGRLELAAGDWEAGHEGLAYAVELLHSVAPRELGRKDQEHGLRTLAGLASQAAWCALRLGRPGRAMELLEQGRGVLIAQALESRASDLSELHVRDAGLAERFERLRERLNAPIPAGAQAEPKLSTAVLRERRSLVAEWNQTLAQIRGLEGLEGFGRPPSIDRLLKQATEGPIITINVSAAFGDAIILTPGGIRTVPLPALTHPWLAQRVERFATALSDITSDTAAVVRRKAAAKELSSVLADLWDTVTGPVLAGLGISAHVPGTPWPRVWWSPTGPLSTLPLHAAGHHDEYGQPDARIVLDRVVSSYIPTVYALEHARQSPLPEPCRDVLVSALTHTPGAPDLRAASRESALLERRYDDVLVLPEAEATRARVLAEIPRHPIAHFACHATTVPGDPSGSHLVLHDGPLTALEISSRHLSGLHLAYLSACSTSETDPAFADEAIHVATAFQLAGYTHVIGTLWPIADNVAPEIADLFHANLALDGQASPSGTALALHQAVHELRSRYPATPALWASHIHLGP